MTIQNRLLISIILIIAAISGTYSYISYSTVKSEYLQGIDGKLLTAAHMARLTVPGDYHDRIVDGNSVSRVRFDRIVDTFNKLCVKLGLERGLSGPLEAVSAYYMKSPPKQMRDSVARDMTEAFIQDAGTDEDQVERIGQSVAGD